MGAHHPTVRQRTDGKRAAQSSSLAGRTPAVEGAHQMAAQPRVANQSEPTRALSQEIALRSPSWRKTRSPDVTAEAVFSPGQRLRTTSLWGPSTRPAKDCLPPLTDLALPFETRPKVKIHPPGRHRPPAPQRRSFLPCDPRRQKCSSTRRHHFATDCRAPFPTQNY